MASEPEEKYVNFPHLDKQKMVVKEETRKKIISRWALIQEELGNLKNVIQQQSQQEGGAQYPTPHAIEDCIATYVPDLNTNFAILEDAYFSKDQVEMEMYDDIIVFIIEAALAITDLFTEPIELLNGGSINEVLVLSKDQICCILGNAFFCTFPQREPDRERFIEYPRINFTELFDDQSNTGPGWKGRFRQAKIEKVKAFFNYFSRMKDRFRKDPVEMVIFERRSLPEEGIPHWKNIQEGFSPLEVHTHGTIEDAVGSLQVDFANMFIGGGTLGSGAAQEEIRFTCCPELVAGQLFTKVLYPRDALLIHRFEQFSSYTGYGSSFKFHGDFEDTNVISNHIVCLDAHQYPKNSLFMQLEKRWIDRELNKCFIAYQSSALCPEEECSKIASGKWGCGVFNGDPILKSLIQWIASSYCQKSLSLYTFGDNYLSSELSEICRIIHQNKFTIGTLYQTIMAYGQALLEENISFLEFLQDTLVAPLPDDNLIPPSVHNTSRKSSLVNTTSEPNSPSPPSPKKPWYKFPSFFWWSIGVISFFYGATYLLKYLPMSWFSFLDKFAFANDLHYEACDVGTSADVVSTILDAVESTSTESTPLIDTLNGTCSIRLHWYNKYPFNQIE